jgi:predicted AAA+ superfamily ATPase
MIFTIADRENSAKLKSMANKTYYNRLLKVRPDKSFFIWGPRQAGKTSFLRKHFPDVTTIDLLHSEIFIRYNNNPERLREEITKSDEKFVIIDEVQKVPMLLNEIHWLIENRGVRFALCGSSARKLKRGAANLLGGRAVRYELFGFVSQELGSDFDLLRALNFGYLPPVYLDADPESLLGSYVSDYLKEEVAAEGLVRNLPPFSDFLRAVAVSDTETVNYTNIASDCGVSRDTAINYYSILTETHLGRFLPAYTRRAKRKVVHAPKFYLFDVGVVNYLARRGRIEPGSELYGKAFENWVFHEISAYLSYFRKNVDLAYWRLTSGTEVDFLLDDLSCAIEAKSSAKIQTKHLKSLKELRKDIPEVKKSVVVSNEPKSRIDGDGVEILSVEDFLKELWQGTLF